ncbi:MAG: AAA family ATPase [Bacteroidales bacterium]|nr:AAA family ATPase [Bacteroidales bacterium]
MKIVGITGTLGAGKGTIVDYLIKTRGFKHFSAREFITREVNRRNYPVNRDTLTSVANELRRKHSPSYIIDMLFDEALEAGANSVIESIRTPGEVESLRRNEQFVLLAVDANPVLRFERIKLRKSETDYIDFETFLENEKREMNNQDPNMQNLTKCIQMADYVLNNDGDLDSLYKQLEDVLSKIK